MRCKLAISRAPLPVVLASLSLVSLFLACGDRQSKVVPITQVAAERPALETDAPVLRWIPPGADLVAVADSLEEFLLAAQQVAGLVPTIDLSTLGTRPWDPAAWSERGILAAAPIGLFISGPTLTAVLPTSEQGKLSAWASEGGGAKVTTQTRRGKTVYTVQEGPAVWSWLEVDGFFLLHLSMATEVAPPPGSGMPWLDAVLKASEGLSYSSTKEAKSAFSFRQKGEAWGSADPLAILNTLVGTTNYVACASLLGKSKGLVFAASVRSPLAKVRSYITLGSESEATLRSLQSLVVSDGMRAKRTGTGLYASLALDPRATSEALQAAQCPELAEVLHDPLAPMGWSPPPRAVHLAGTRFIPDKLSGDLALDLALHNKRFIAGQLGRVPGRSFFEKSMKVHGIRVKRLSIPTMSSLYYHLSNERFVFGTKKSIMETILAPNGNQERESDELLAAGLWPARVPQLGLVLRELIPAREQREAVAQFLGRMDHAQASIHLKGNRLSLDIELQLRAGVTSLW